MKFAHLLLAAAGCAAVGAQAQSLDPSASPQLQGKPLDQAFDKSFQPFPRGAIHDDAPQLDKRVFPNYHADRQITAGYELVPNLSIETGYTGLNREGAHPIDAGDAGGLAGAGNSKGFSTHVAAKVTAPLTDRLSAYGKLGIAHSERTSRDKLVTESTQTDTGAYVGAGTEYKLNNKATLSGQYERYGNSDNKFGGDTNAGGVSARLNVGF